MATPKLLWSCVARNDTILVEAAAAAAATGSAPLDGGTSPLSIAQAARELLARPATPGFEFHTTRFWGASVAAAVARKQSESSKPLKGIKFHVYDHVHPNDDFDADFLGQTNASASPATSTPQLCIWVFAAVYDPTVVTDRTVVQSFLEKMVHLTENFRLYDPLWYTADTLGLQESFAPILQQQMSQVDSIHQLSRLEQSVEACRDQMERNIALLLERGERLQDLDESATRLQEMAVVFQKKARDVKRYQMRKNAKHGLLLGTAVTAATAVVIVPPLVAFL